MTLPSHPWHDKTEAEKLEWLATEVMGWKRGAHPDGITARAEWWYIGSVAIRPAYKNRSRGVWNPLTDWGHWRQVEEKVMEDGRLHIAYTFQFDQYGAPLNPIMAYLKTDLPTRAQVLYNAYSSLKQ